MTQRLTLAAAKAHQAHIALGDLATWALFAGAAPIALRQLRIQQNDSVRRTRQLERKQANKVDFTWCPIAQVHVLSTIEVPPDGQTVVVVANNSRRPIRNVTCRIGPPEGDALQPVMLGVAEELELDNVFAYRLFDPRAMTQFPVIRPGFKYGFLFHFTIPDDDASRPDRRVLKAAALFTDDAGLSWEIDDDLHLHLKKSKPPAQTWRGLMMPPDPG